MYFWVLKLDHWRFFNGSKNRGIDEKNNDKISLKFGMIKYIHRQNPKWNEIGRRLHLPIQLEHSNNGWLYLAWVKRNL